MSGILVDSNVLLDVIAHDKNWFGWSSEALVEAAEISRLVINAIIYSEVSVRYSRIEDLEQALSKLLFDREPIPFAAAFLAGKAHLAYRSRTGTKRFALPDFFVGAHAVIAGYQLLTRDPKRYRTYFPDIALIAP